jgi:hypothetical protein
LGVTSASLAETLRIATLGDYDVALPKLNLAQRQVPIVVRLDSLARQDMGLLERLTVPGAKGPVLLGQVASLELSGGPAVIDRYNRSRNITFEVELSGKPLGEVTTAVAALPSIAALPAGVKVLEIGDAEVMGELFASFGLAMLTGVICIYIVLVLLFGAFLQPITILMALPLSLGGAFVGLDNIVKSRIKGTSIGFNAKVSNDKTAHLDQTTPEDLIKFGMIPEFVGRFPSWVALEELTKADLIKILQEVKHSYVSQYQWLFQRDQVELQFSADSLELIAERTIANKTGARGLHSELERVLLPHMYNLSRYRKHGIHTVSIDTQQVNIPKELKEINQ